MFLSFNFSVSIVGDENQSIEFSEVSGLEKELVFEEFSVGGVNNGSVRLPKNFKFSELVLKKGRSNKVSKFDEWLMDFISKEQTLNFIKNDLLISLNDEKKVPLVSWFVSNARIAQYTPTSLNASKNELFIEQVKLTYEYFKVLD